jgi:Mrp family chromosome partitioning ATPase
MRVGAYGRILSIPRIGAPTRNALDAVKTWAGRTRAQEIAAARPVSPLDEVDERPSSAYSRAVETLWTIVAPDPQRKLGGRAWTILVTSTPAARGKTVLAVNLARLAARSGARTLLIEGNSAGPKLSELIDDKAEANVLELWGAARVIYAASSAGNAAPLRFAPILSSESFILRRLAGKSDPAPVSLDDFDVAIIDSGEADRTEQIYKYASAADRIALVARPGAANDVEKFVSHYGILFRHRDADQLTVLEDAWRAD